MSSPFKWAAVTAHPKENGRRKWLSVLVLLMAVLVVAGYEVASTTGLSLQTMAKPGEHTATMLLVNIRSDLPSIDRFDSLQWGVVSRQAAAALGERNAIVGHIITFLLVMLSCGLGFVVLRSIRDMVAANDGRQENGYLHNQRSDKETAPYFTLGEGRASKDDQQTAFRVELREYELGIDLSEDQFTSGQSATPEPEWKL